MSSLAVGLIPKSDESPKAALKKGRVSSGDSDSGTYVEFEMEVLYARIDELEKKKNFYKKKLQQIKQLLQFHFDNPIKIREGLVKVFSKASSKTTKKVSDIEIKNAISKIVIVD